ncbi:MAG: hypothetical protein GY880_16960 [Planctomycetaceae bacterium]|jgi:hypothetical protein|nr:hypothetical protein [Planctomycetaceae bacterium]MCP4476935.1 hypothetical protein [Planctomycetaceae bacterium]MCP4775920.1 hypothetical protein [Planctomycetaceae bacterium]
MNNTSLELAIYEDPLTDDLLKTQGTAEPFHSAMLGLLHSAVKNTTKVAAPTIFME